MKKCLLLLLLTTTVCLLHRQTHFKIDARGFREVYKANSYLLNYPPPLGVSLLDASGTIIRKTTPIFNIVSPFEQTDFIPVRLEITRINPKTNEFEGESGIWICLDKELKIKFVFPLETTAVRRPLANQNSGFIFTTSGSPAMEGFVSTNNGVIDTSGEVM